MPTAPKSKSKYTTYLLLFLSLFLYLFRRHLLSLFPILCFLSVCLFRFYLYLRNKSVSSLIQNLTYGFILSFILLYQFIPLNATFKYVSFVILFAFSLPVIFIKFKSNKIDRWIGEFSYPIYICHVFIIILVNVFYSKYHFVSHHFLSLIILICTLIFSYFLIKFISEPIEKIRYNRTLKLHSK